MHKYTARVLFLLRTGLELQSVEEKKKRPLPLKAEGASDPICVCSLQVVNNLLRPLHSRLDIGIRGHALLEERALHTNRMYVGHHVNALGLHRLLNLIKAGGISVTVQT